MVCPIPFCPQQRKAARRRRGSQLPKEDLDNSDHVPEDESIGLFTTLEVS